MIVVIQCAASKREAGGRLVTRDGKPVLFVADPSAAPNDDTVVYKRPDDPSDRKATWRDVLLEYNNTQTDNPLGLLPAWSLYDNPIYGRLVETFGLPNVYILSAGWGLLDSRFLTPDYDITFSASANKENVYKRRRKADVYRDFCQLPPGSTDDIVFFGGMDYLPLFCTLTASIRALKTVFYNSHKIPPAAGCKLLRFETSTRTNWHYECANAFLDGSVKA